MAAKKKRSRTSLAVMQHQGDIQVQIDISSQQKMLKKLDRLDDRTRTRILRPAMLKGIQKIKRKLKDTAPRNLGPKASRKNESSRKSMKRAFAHTIRNVGGTIMTRTGLPEGYGWAHMLHTGAPPHVIKPRRGKILRMIFGGFARTIQHPGFAPNPFVVNAIKTTGRAVRAAIIKKAWQGIVKEAMKK